MPFFCAFSLSQPPPRSSHRHRPVYLALALTLLFLVLAIPSTASPISTTPTAKNPRPKPASPAVFLPSPTAAPAAAAAVAAAAPAPVAAAATPSPNPPARSPISLPSSKPAPPPKKATLSKQPLDARALNASQPTAQPTAGPVSNSSTPVAVPARKKTVGDLFRNARGSKSISGVKELFEWALVLILIAPGTFPAMSCIILACAAFWRRQARAVWPMRARGSEPELLALGEGEGEGESEGEGRTGRRRNPAGVDGSGGERDFVVPLLTS